MFIHEMSYLDFDSLFLFNKDNSDVSCLHLVSKDTGLRGKSQKKTFFFF